MEGCKSKTLPGYSNSLPTAKNIQRWIFKIRLIFPTLIILTKLFSLFYSQIYMMLSIPSKNWAENSMLRSLEMVKLAFLNITTLSQLRICRPPPKCSDSYERCGMCWIERKIIFKIFTDLCFSSSSHLLLNFRLIFTITRKIKFGKNLNCEIYFVSAHSASFVRIWPFWWWSAYP